MPTSKLARDLEPGDKIAITVMGGSDYLEVDRCAIKGSEMYVEMSWGWHVPRHDKIYDRFPLNEEIRIVNDSY